MSAMSSRHLTILLTCCVFSSFLSVASLRWLFPEVKETAEQPMINPRLEDLRLKRFTSSAPTDFTNAAERVTPAVVFVRSYHHSRHLLPNVESTTTGSAVIISSEGLIATNNHVIEGAHRIRITLEDRREYDAKVLGVDQSTDLALLKINAYDLPYLQFGNSDSLRVGEWVLAVGNPFNLKSTVTAGIVSAKGRSIDVLESEDRIESFIQTDAAVNPGNSGGALVNTQGELIGINTAIITNSGRHEGYAFAIPGNLAGRVLNDLRDFGEVKRAVLGVYIQGINDAQAKRLRLPAARGAIITDLIDGGPAGDAGLRKGDVLTSINGVVIDSSPELQEQMSRYRPGQRIVIDFIRNRRPRQVNILLRDKANRTRMLVSENSDDLLHHLGFEVQGLRAGGVEVISVFRNSLIERTNMNPGFRISHVNGKRVTDLNSFLSYLISGEDLRFRGTYEGYAGEYFYELVR